MYKGKEIGCETRGNECEVYRKLPFGDIINFTSGDTDTGTEPE